MENTTTLEYISMIVLFPVIPVQVIVLVIEFFVFIVYRLFSKDKIRFSFKDEATPEEEKWILVIMRSRSLLSFLIAYGFDKALGVIIAVPFVVCSVLLYANWRLACRIYTLHKYGTEKRGIF